MQPGITHARFPHTGSYYALRRLVSAKCRELTSDTGSFLKSWPRNVLFYGTRSPLLCSQNPAIETYPDQLEYILHPRTMFVCFSTYCCPLFAKVSKVVSSPQGFQLKCVLISSMASPVSSSFDMWSHRDLMIP